MSSEVAISVKNLSKCYQIYNVPHDRLKQSIYPKMQRTLGLEVKQYYREFWALNDVSFDVKKGQTVGIVGRNGSGKSTLLQMICGTLNPTSGDVFTNGRIAALLELGSGFNPEFTGRENIYMNASVIGLQREEIQAKFDDIVAFADIGDFVEQPVKTYSSGMLVRLAFAVIAHVNADILIVDEALAVGDAFFTQKCMRFLREFMKNGTVLFVSHDTASVKNLCNHAIWLENGKVIKAGTPKEVCDGYLQNYYESQQGKGAPVKSRLMSTNKTEDKAEWTDQRLKYINSGNLRNDLEIFRFNPEAASFGKGGAQIVDVIFYDPSGSPLLWVVGGEEVTLKIFISIIMPLSSPIVGFSVKDRLGQVLFGENTYLSYADFPKVCQPGEQLIAEFSFQMPILPVGNYSVEAAIADGTQTDHVQHHWVRDALLFKSESASVATGLVGVPMRWIKLDVVERQD